MKRKPKLRDRLALAAQRAGALWFAARDEATLDRAAHTAWAEGVEHVAILGGDGTASMVLTALAEKFGARPLPTIALLRGGTMNTVANSLGIRRSAPMTLLQRALGAYRGQAPLQSQVRRPLSVGGRLGFLFGTGVTYGFLQEYYAAGKGDPTPRTVVQVLTRCVASSLVRGEIYSRIRNPEPVQVRHADGLWERHPYLAVAAGSVAQVGLGFTPFSRCEESTDRFHLLAFAGQPVDIIRDLPSIWRGRGVHQETAYETTTPWAELRSERPFGYFLDGDLSIAPDTLRLELGPSLRLLRI